MAESDTLWALTWPDKQLLFRTGVNSGTPHGSGWIRIPTPRPSDFLTCDSAGRAWVIDAAGGFIYMRTDVSFENPVGTDWLQVGTSCGFKSVAAQPSKGLVFAINAANQLVRRKEVSPEDPSGSEWEQIPSCLEQLKLIALHPRGKALWVVTVKDKIYVIEPSQLNSKKPKWQKIQIPPKKIRSVSLQSSYAVVADETSKLWVYFGRDFLKMNSKWLDMKDHQVVQASGFSCGRYWCLTNEHKAIVQATGWAEMIPERRWSKSKLKKNSSKLRIDDMTGLLCVVAGPEAKERQEWTESCSSSVASSLLSSQAAQTLSSSEDSLDAKPVQHRQKKDSPPTDTSTNRASVVSEAVIYAEVMRGTQRPSNAFDYPRNLGIRVRIQGKDTSSDTLSKFNSMPILSRQDIDAKYQL